MNENITGLLKRVELFLNDGEFEKADEYIEKILDLDPTVAKMYLYKLLITFKQTSFDQFFNFLHKEATLVVNKNYVGKNSDLLKTDTNGFFKLDEINRVIEKTKHIIESDKVNHVLLECDKNYFKFIDFSNEDEELYIKIMEINNYYKLQLFEFVELLKNKLPEFEHHNAKIISENKQNSINKKKKLKVLSLIIVVGILILLALPSVITAFKYYTSINRFGSIEELNKSIASLESIPDYKDSKDKVLEAKYAKAALLFQQNRFNEAHQVYSGLSDFKDSSIKKIDAMYMYLDQEITNGNYDIIKQILPEIADYEYDEENLVFLIARKCIERSLSENKFEISAYFLPYVKIDERKNLRNEIKLAESNYLIDQFKKNNDINQLIDGLIILKELDDTRFDKGMKVYSEVVNNYKVECQHFIRQFS